MLFGLAAPALAQADLVIEDVSVIDVETGQIATGQTVAVEDGRIVSVGAGDPVAEPDAIFISGEGRFLIPGLWDAHVHSAYNADWHFPLFLAHGVTSVRNMHTTDENGFEQVQRLRSETRGGAILGPRFIANGFIVDGGEGAWPQSIIASDVETARAAVDAHVANGMDFVKVYNSLSADAYRAILERARERGIAVDGHLPESMYDQIDFSLGQRTFEHAIEMAQGCTDWDSAPDAPPDDLAPYTERVFWFGVYDEFLDTDMCRDTARAMAANGAVAVPTFINTLTFSHAAELMAGENTAAMLPRAVGEEWAAMAASPEAGEMLASRPDPWIASRAYVQLWQDAGVTLLAGTDVGNPFMVPGDSLLRELELMVELGMPEDRALATATINPARVFAIEKLGLVAPGYDADLVLLDANPLDDIANIRQIVGVVRQGVYYPRETLNRNVTMALERANQDQDE
ncbi:amidohydrolase family protein [Aurantiacibacter hainanensis]|uniref:amidohydrolase family protein n=1 Tax=Aurantiacibacter hainanensis TaxID=3076114 RepID=UPI0030C70B03